MIADLLKIAAVGALIVLSSKPGFARDRGGPAPEALYDCSGPNLALKQCAAVGPDGRPHLNRSSLPRLAYDSHGLAAVYLSGPADARTGQWFYVRRRGGMAPVEAYDNGPDEFPDGLARSPVGQKIGYIDRRLRLVIPAKYDGAYPFEHGAAVVCVGCTVVSDGEHNWYEGGAWGCIDRRGRELKSLRPREQGQRFDAVCGH